MACAQTSPISFAWSKANRSYLARRVSLLGLLLCDLIFANFAAFSSVSKNLIP